MNDYKLKVLLTVLGALVFSLFFILLAFVTPVKKESTAIKMQDKPKNKLEEISKSLRE